MYEKLPTHREDIVRDTSATLINTGPVREWELSPYQTVGVHLFTTLLPVSTTFVSSEPMIYCTYVLYLLLVTRKTPSGYTNSVCRNNMWVTDRRRQVRDLYTFAVVPGRVDRTFKMNPD